jgi:DNA-binding NarL/FixJ family response regulator
MTPTQKKTTAIPAYVQKRIVQLDEEGLQRVQIAQRFSITDETVRKYLKQAGRPIHMRGMRVVKLRGLDSSK